MGLACELLLKDHAKRIYQQTNKNANIYWYAN